MDVANMPFMRSKATHRGFTDGRGYTHLFLNEFFTGHPPEIARAALEGMGLGLDVRGRTAYRLSPAIIENGMINWSYHAEEFCDRLIPKVEEHMDILHSCAALLIEKEKITRDEFEALFEKEKGDVAED